MPTSDLVAALCWAKWASAWSTNSLEGTEPQARIRAVALTPLEMGEAATRVEPKLRNKERAALKNILLTR